MTGSVKPPRSQRRRAATHHDDLEAFFAGVTEMRAYLDRHIQDPERRRERLARIAGALAKRRSPVELADWLAAQLREALGAAGCAVFRHEGAWLPWRQAGVVRVPPTAAELGKWINVSPGRFDQDPLQTRHGIVVALAGLDGLVGALWIEEGHDLDPVSRALLQAIADTAGAALEQSLSVQALAYDSVTGLIHDAAFIAAAEDLLAAAGRAGQHLALMGARLAGFDVIARLHDQAAARSAVVQLGRTVREAAPDGALVGRRYDDLYVIERLDAGAAWEEVEAGLAGRARNVSAALQHAPHEPSLACKVVYGLRQPPLRSVALELGDVERQLSAMHGAGIARLVGVGR